MKECIIMSEFVFNRRYDTYEKDVKNICFKRMKNTMDAEDAIQTTWMKVAKLSRVFDSAIHEKAYVLRMCVNVCNDLLNMRNKHVCLDADFFETLEQIVDEDIDFESLITHLDQKDQEILRMRYVKDLKFKDIAEVTGHLESTVRKRHERALKMLSSLLSVVSQIYYDSTNEHNCQQKDIK